MTPLGTSLFILALISTRATFADATRAAIKSDTETYERLCKSKKSNLIQKTDLTGQVSYFVKPLIHNGKLYFTAVLGFRPQIIDSSGKTLIYLDGNQDPLVSFDNEILTVLKGSSGRFEMKFMDPKNLDEEKTVPLQSDINIFGAYQSIAPIKTPTGEKAYRMVIESMTESVPGTVYRPAEYYQAPLIMEFKKTENKIEKISEFKNPCAGKDLKIPFLSKNGSMLAALNLDTQTTQVFDISDGQCNLQYDLGFATGKADFSYDDQKITFHLAAKPAADSAGWIRDLGSDNSSNVFTYNLKSKKITQVTHNQNANSYYPAFLPDGTIMHIDSETPQWDRSGPPQFSIGVSREAPHEDKKTPLDPNCTTSEPELLRARFAIGHLLYSLCAEPTYLGGDTNNKFDTSYFIMKANEVTSQECASLVTKFWDSRLQAELLAKQKVENDPKLAKLELGKLKKEDLLVACKAR